MEEHQIAFMADKRVDGAVLSSSLHSCERGSGFFKSRLLPGRRKSSPGGPAESHHLVQDAGAFEGQWYGGKRGHRSFILAQGVTPTDWLQAC
jgi:hypothetical protein